jgi:putative spermidine/putrescine transport system substrate-binding protein
MDFIVSPKINAQVAEYFGEAPAQTLACQQTADKGHCGAFHALDSAYAAKIHYWATPQKQCLSGGGNDCTSYDQWVDKWQQIKG